MAKNNLLNCVPPTKAIEFVISASGVTRNRFFSDAGITSKSGYNFLKEGKTITCDNWYQLIASLPDPMYQLYIKLITRVHKDTPLKGSLEYDPFLFTTKREISPHSISEVLPFLTDVYDLSISDLSYQTGLSPDVLKLYLKRATQKPRLDRLWVILSAFPITLVLEFEWFMRNVHSNTPLTDYEYIKIIN
jgi:hypothetical protein